MKKTKSAGGVVVNKKTGGFTHPSERQRIFQENSGRNWIGGCCYGSVAVQRKLVYLSRIFCEKISEKFLN
jgi:hypothetical protein